MRTHVLLLLLERAIPGILDICVCRRVTRWRWRSPRLRTHLGERTFSFSLGGCRTMPIMRIRHLCDVRGACARAAPTVSKMAAASARLC